MLRKLFIMFLENIVYFLRDNFLQLSLQVNIMNDTLHKQKSLV
jgi:hypothetical protein